MSPSRVIGSTEAGSSLVAGDRPDARHRDLGRIAGLEAVQRRLDHIARQLDLALVDQREQRIAAGAGIAPSSAPRATTTPSTGAMMRA